MRRVYHYFGCYYNTATFFNMATNYFYWMLAVMSLSSPAVGMKIDRAQTWRQENREKVKFHQTVYINFTVGSVGMFDTLIVVVHF